MLPLLPTEIKAVIVRHLRTKSDVLNLLATSSPFFYLCQPLLHGSVRLSLGGPNEGKRMIGWCQFILASLHRAAWVLAMEITSRKDDGEEGREDDESTGWGESGESGHCKWAVGGGVRRILFQALGKLKNLRALCFDLPEQYSCLLQNPSLEFPDLEDLELTCVPLHQCQAFLERHHRQIRKLRLHEANRLQPSPRQIKGKGFLPLMVWYSGPASLLNHMSRSTRLQQIFIRNSFQPLERSLLPMLRKHGRTLHSLSIWLTEWRGGLVRHIAENAPLLEELRLDICPLGAPLDRFCTESQDARPRLKLLKFLAIINQGGIPRSQDQELDYLEAFRESCPSLRMVFISYRGEAVVDWDFSWRFSEAKQRWIPPEVHDEWWSTRAPRTLVTIADYQAVFPPQTGINDTFAVSHGFGLA